MLGCRTIRHLATSSNSNPYKQHPVKLNKVIHAICTSTASWFKVREMSVIQWLNYCYRLQTCKKAGEVYISNLFKYCPLIVMDIWFDTSTNLLFRMFICKVPVGEQSSSYYHFCSHPCFINELSKNKTQKQLCPSLWHHAHHYDTQEGIMTDIKHIVTSTYRTWCREKKWPIFRFHTFSITC